MLISSITSQIEFAPGFKTRGHTRKKVLSDKNRQNVLAYFMSASSNTPVAGTTSFWESKDFDTGRQ
jgi:hypothetical protein